MLLFSLALTNFKIYTLYYDYIVFIWSYLQCFIFIDVYINTYLYYANLLHSANVNTVLSKVF